MGLTNIKHRIYGGLGRIGVPLLILALFTWGIPRTAEAHHHYGYGYGFGGHRYGYAPTPLDEVAKVVRLAGLGALDLKTVKPKKTAVYLNRVSPTDHQGWDALLKDFVNDDSRVDYARLNSEAFDRLVAYSDQLAGTERPDWGSQEGKALLINAYNALIIRWIVENYPTASIMATPNPFRAKRHRLAGEWVSLDDIERRLRETGDPRIHSVLVCAALSCPSLRREAYVAERLDEQLDDNTRQWLANEQLNQFDSQQVKAELSPIFSWYEEDFKSYPRGLAGFVREYGPADRTQLLGSRELSISFKGYSWGLNDQSGIGQDYSNFRLAVDWIQNWFR